MKTAIVTGASGFVGGAVLRELLAHDYKVYAVVREGREATLPSNVNCIPVFCDLANISKKKKKIPTGEQAVFIHLAWAGVSPDQRIDTALQLKNVQASTECLQTAKKLGCFRFIGAGSIMEQETLAATLAQDCRLGMGYVYGAAKLTAHSMCKALAVQVGIDFIWCTLTNIYGVGDHSRRLINTSILKCLHGESPQFTAATQYYDFVYIDDAAFAFRLIAEKGISFRNYLIGSGHARPLREFLLEMQAAVAPQLEFIFGTVPFTGVNLDLSVFDTSLTMRDTGFKSKVGFSEGCSRVIRWWKAELGVK